MNQDVTCDVAVVGGGPAGAMSAAGLARRGVDVVLLERARVPRWKCCAGGLTAAAVALLPPAAVAVIENEIRELRVSSVGGRCVSWSAAEPFMYTASRERLDAALWQEAVRCGARAFDGHEVLKVEQDREGVVLVCPDRTVRCRIAIGADGAAGIVGGPVMRGQRRHVAVGMVREFERAAGEEPSRSGRVDLIVGLHGRNYGWVFPRRDVVSVGIESHGVSGRRESALESVCAVAGMQGRVAVRRGVHPIPTLTGAHPRIVSGRVLLVGDAAGLCDPLTGEGVRHALLSAGLAAETVPRALEAGPGALREYAAAVHDTIVPELRSAALMLPVLFGFESAGLLVLQHDARARRAALATLRGEMSYRDLLWRVGGIPGFASLIEGRAE